jgi:hypothetical protein
LRHAARLSHLNLKNKVGGMERPPLLIQTIGATQSLLLGDAAAFCLIYLPIIS